MINVQTCDSSPGVYGFIIEVLLGEHYFMERRRVYTSVKSAMDALKHMKTGNYNYRITPIGAISKSEWRNIVISEALNEDKKVKLIDSYKLIDDHITITNKLLKAGTLIARLCESWEYILVLSNSKTKGFSISKADFEDLLRNNKLVEVNLPDESNYRPHFNKKIKEAIASL